MGMLNFVSYSTLAHMSDVMTYEMLRRLQYLTLTKTLFMQLDCRYFADCRFPGFADWIFPWVWIADSLHPGLQMFCALGCSFFADCGFSPAERPREFNMIILPNRNIFQNGRKLNGFPINYQLKPVQTFNLIMMIRKNE